MCRPWTAQAILRTFSWPETVRNVSLPKNPWVKSIFPAASARHVHQVERRDAEQRTAPSASEAVMIGVLTRRNPFS